MISKIRSLPARGFGLERVTVSPLSATIETGPEADINTSPMANSVPSGLSPISDFATSIVVSSP